MVYCHQSSAVFTKSLLSVFSGNSEQVLNKTKSYPWCLCCKDHSDNMLTMHSVLTCTVLYVHKLNLKQCLTMASHVILCSCKTLSGCMVEWTPINALQMFSLPMTPFHHWPTLWSPTPIPQMEICLQKLWLLSNDQQIQLYLHHSLINWSTLQSHNRRT